MIIRRIVCVALLVALAGLLVPGVSEAGVFDRGDGGAWVEPDLFARVADWFTGQLADLGALFTAARGALITGGG